MTFEHRDAGRRRPPALLPALGLALGLTALGATAPTPASAATRATTRTAPQAVPHAVPQIVAPAAPQTTAPAATVTYQIGTDWGTGFQANLTVTPAVAVTGGWTLEFDAGDQQTLTFAALAGATQTGRHVTLTNRTFNGTLAAGQTLSLTVQFSNPTYSDVPPAGFVFDGQAAAYSPSPYLVVSDPRPTVPEGGTGTITVRLSQAPASDVVFEILGPPAPAPITASPGRLSFTAADWDVPQTVTLASPRDADTANQTSTFQLEQIQGYPALFPTDVLLATQLDNG